jgi:hypothetical protein
LVVDLEIGIGKTALQFPRGKDLDRRHQTKELSDRRDDIEPLHRISDASRTGDESAARFEHLMDLGLARSTGGAAGAALFGAVVFALRPHLDVVQAFHRAFLVAAGIAALGALTASLVPRVKLWP